MPSEWRGTWFEAGVGDITITSHSVLSKGLCVENINDYYLFDNRCVLHANLHCTSKSPPAGRFTLCRREGSSRRV